MSQLTGDQLEAMLVDYGWTFEALGPNVWRTGFRGEQRLFPLHIRLSQTCISFEVEPLVDLKLDASRWTMVSRDLLELNAKLQLVKVAISDGGEVTLACQVLVAGFSADTLHRVLGIIGYYADEVAPEIYQRLAATPVDKRPPLLS